MTHAFLITAYKDLEQLSSLIQQLKHRDSYIYIHIDKKSKQLLDNLKDKFSPKDNVFVISDPVKVNWGGFSHLQAILLLINEAKKNPLPNYFHLISGQDFPITSRTAFDSFFEANAGKEFLSYAKMPDSQWEDGGLKRIDYYHLNDILDPKKYLFPRLNGRFLRLQKFLHMKRKYPTYIKDFYGGGTWWSLSRNSITEICSFTTQHPSFADWFKNTHCSEEVFFQTILLNSSLKDKVVNDDLRYVNWDLKNGSCPANLDESDLETILNCKNKFFARKIDSSFGKGLREKLTRKNV